MLPACAASRLFIKSLSTDFVLFVVVETYAMVTFYKLFTTRLARARQRGHHLYRHAMCVGSSSIVVCYLLINLVTTIIVVIVIVTIIFVVAAVAADPVCFAPFFLFVAFEQQWLLFCTAAGGVPRSLIVLSAAAQISTRC